MDYINYISKLTKLGFETGKGNSNAFNEIFGDDDGRIDHEYQREKDEKAMDELDKADFATEQDFFWQEAENNDFNTTEKI